MVRLRCGVGKVYSLVISAIVLLLLFVLLSDRGPNDGGKGPESSPGKRRHAKLIASSKAFPLLQQSKIDQVENFLFFIGYPRSGHSIVAACLDAHPDVVIAHEFNLFQRLTRSDVMHDQLLNRTLLYNGLYLNSLKSVRTGSRSQDAKGYSLLINSSNSWQGKIRNLKVIGDKSGGVTARVARDSPELFAKLLNELQHAVQVPIKTIHVVRNPYDMVATRILYRLSSVKGHKANFSASHPVKNAKTITQAINGLRSEAEAVESFIDQRESSTFEMHNLDFIHQTEDVMLKLCSFLNLDCPDDYLQVCREATFKQSSRSRQSLKWTKSHQKAMSKVVADFSFFRRYSFQSE